MGTTTVKWGFWKCSYISLPVVLFVAFLSRASRQGEALPHGTTLPVRLEDTLNSNKDSPGKPFALKTTQDIPLDGHQVIRKGTKITGHVVSVQSLKKGECESRLVLQFDRLQRSGQETSIVVGLRAMANLLEVQEAGMPTSAEEDSANWTTVQIGGDVVYRGGGPVTTSWGEPVGKPVNDGVMSRLVAPRNELVAKTSHCAPSEKLHALGFFASTACGVYGFADLTIAEDGFDEPKGRIALVSSSKTVRIRAGAQLLLQVPGP